KATTAKVIPIKPAKTTATTAAKATPAKAATAKTRAPRAKKTTPAVPAVTTFPPNMFYLETALEGPLGPGGIAHRPARYPVTSTTERGGRRCDYLTGAACHPTTTRPRSDTNPDTDEPATETVPTVACREHSASWVQAHGV